MSKSDTSIYDAVCFQGQQCAEKYLQVFLQENDIDIPRTHKLQELLKLCKEIDVSYEMLLPDLQVIEQFAVNIRYPGMTADKDEAKRVFKATQVVHLFVQQQLNISQ